MMSIMLTNLMQQQISGYAKHPSQALLLTGVNGSGKTTLLGYIASKLLDEKIENLDGHPKIMYVTDNKSISIEKIREARQFIKLKTNTANSISRIIIIDNADKMTTEAQNALLKTLEEPPKGTVVLLSASSANNLLSTVTSRCQIMPILQPSHGEIIRFCKSQGYSDQQIERAYIMSGGTIGSVVEILSDNNEQTNNETYQLAKNILQAKKYERLLFLQNVSSVSEAADLVFAMKRIIQIALRSNNDNQNNVRLIKTYEIIQKIDKALHATAPNLKLLTTYLAIEL